MTSLAERFRGYAARFREEAAKYPDEAPRYELIARTWDAGAIAFWAVVGLLGFRVLYFWG